MITFKDYTLGYTLPSFLLEGGNVQIGDKTAQHINLKDHERDIVSDLIMKSLIKVNSKFKEEYGLYIWKPSILKDGKIFSGSTKHFFDQRISTEKFLKHKSSVGDIDLMVDQNLKTQIKDFIENHKDEDFESLNLIGNKMANDQNITLWKLEPMGINVQIDLEFVEFLNDKPTDWAEFSHSSSFSDLEQGIKGAFHKLLMISLLGHKKTDSILQLKTKQNDIKAGTYTLSIKGIRQKYEKIGVQDGKPVVRETNSKDYNKNFYEILKQVFDIDATEEDVKHFWSFTGILKLMKKNLKDTEIQKILEEFMDILFGAKAQGLYRGDPNRDLDEKMLALNLAQEKLNTKVDKFELERLQKEYYIKYK